ncbi:MAG: hypothetical protein E6H08_10765, partial [Bacteroidetes bacterium]
MKFQAIFYKIIKAATLSIALVAFNCLATNAQTTPLKSSVYKNYIRPGSTVKIQTLEGERIRKTDTSVVNNIQLPVNKKNI